MVQLPPRGQLQKQEEIALLFGLFVAFVSCLSVAYIISYKKWSRYIPFLSGIIGMITVIASILLAPLVIPSGSVGRWDESFVDQYTTISVLQMYQPMRAIIPLGFSFVCLGIATSTIKMWNSRHFSFGSKKMQSGNKQKLVMTLLILSMIINFATILGTLGSLIFARHVDGELHVFFAYIVFSGWALSPIMTTSLMLCVDGRPLPNKLCLSVLTITTILIVALSTLYIFAYSSKGTSSSIIRGEGDLALMEHVIFILELTWISTLGTQFLSTKNNSDKEKDFLSIRTVSSIDTSEIEQKQIEIETLRTGSFPHIVIEVNDNGCQSCVNLQQR